MNWLALGLLFAGITSAARGTMGGKIVGILVIFTGVALIFPNLAYYPENAAALITLSLMIFGLEPIIAGITGRRRHAARDLSGMPWKLWKALAAVALLFFHFFGIHTQRMLCYRREAISRRQRQPWLESPLFHKLHPF